MNARRKAGERESENLTSGELRKREDAELGK